MEQEKKPRTTIAEIPVYCAYDEILDITQVVPNPKNPNTHGEKQIDLLSRIIRGNGWRNAITISKRSGYVVKGHGRLAAAAKLGTKAVPVEYQGYESEAAEYADMMADNRIAELAEINTIQLADLLQEFDTGELPMELTGYTEEDLEGILDAIAGVDDAEANDQDDEYEPEKKVAPLSRPGDLWLLGENRLVCGDATNPDDFKKLMNGEKAALVTTDPPYGVSYVSQSQKFEMIQNDDKTHDELYAKLLVPAFKNLVRNSEPDAAFYIWHASSTRRDFEDAMTAVGLMENQYITWIKNGFTLGRSDYQWGTEYCFYANKAGERPKFYGDRAQNTAWRITTKKDSTMATTLGNGLVITDGAGAKLYVTDQPPKGKKVRYLRAEPGTPVEVYSENKATTAWEVSRETGTLHPTQKPIDLITIEIENSSQPDEIVLDCFGGSGSALIAADKAGRRGYAIELSPHYVDVIVTRYLLSTGNIGITLIRDGEEMSYMEVLEPWMTENGIKDKVMSNKIPVPIFSAKQAEEDDTDGVGGE